jgi:hypothetical protein
MIELEILCERAVWRTHQEVFQSLAYAGTLVTNFFDNTGFLSK